MNSRAFVAAQRPSTAAPLVRLNPVDRLVLLTDRELHRRGTPGFTCQIHVRFDGRLNLQELREAIAAAAARWPLLTARLVKHPDWGWSPTREATCGLQETSLASDREDDLALAATRLLGEPLDITREAPVRFVVQHAANGNDVLTMQYSHVLMDGHGGIGLMRELLGCAPPAATGSASTQSRFGPASSTDGRPWWRTLGDRRRPRAPRTVPVTYRLPPDQPLASRLLLRWLDADAHRRLRARLARAGMTANVSLAVVASGFRAVARRWQRPYTPDNVFETVLRFNARPHNALHSYFQNQYGRATLSVRPSELDDREALIRRLAAEFRGQFDARRHEEFLRGAGLASRLARWAPRFGRWVLRRSVTLTVGSFGEIAPLGRPAFGATMQGGFLHPVPFLQSPVIADVFPVGERLLMCLTSCAAAVTEDDARRLLDDWVEDLTAS